MTATFSVVAHPERDLVRITLAGFFTADDIGRFRAARALAHGRLTCARNQHLTITDITGMAIQSQEAVGRWASVLSDPAWVSRRLGFVTASTLARMQLQRAITGRDNVRCFMDAAEAEAWVLEAGPAAVRAA